ncbi:hypothetical protein [Halosimplex sp. TS25]|uniref:hypothetical protein n=1 Tax=Halosimplex rarum TaxID=3396619 RepID=UPI0039EB0C30
MTSGRHLVVLAGADAGAVDSMAATLRGDGTVRTAYSPAGLRETLDDEVDVVLVGSDLRDGPLEPILAELRTSETGWRIAVLDSEADSDWIWGRDRDRNRDSPRDGPEVPVDAVAEWDEDAVRATVSRLAARARYRKRLEEYYALAEERAAVADEDEDAAPKRDRLDRQIDRLRRDLADGFRRIDDASAFDAALSPRERKLDGDCPNAPDGSEGSEEPDGTEPDVCDE